MTRPPHPHRLLGHSATALLLAATLAGCAPDGAPTFGTTSGGRDVDGVTAAAATKIAICHVNNGVNEWTIIDVSESALDTHLGHGDYLPFVAYTDGDGDGAGDPSSALDGQCELPAGTVANADDCDDTDSSTWLGAEEVCGDGVDNDCDGSVDEDCGPAPTGCPCVDDIFVYYDEGRADIPADATFFDMIGAVGEYDGPYDFRYNYCTETPDSISGAYTEHRRFAIYSESDDTGDYDAVGLQVYRAGEHTATWFGIPEGQPACEANAWDYSHDGWKAASALYPNGEGPTALTEAQFDACNAVIDQFIADGTCQDVY